MDVATQELLKKFNKDGLAEDDITNDPISVMFLLEHLRPNIFNINDDAKNVFELIPNVKKDKVDAEIRNLRYFIEELINDEEGERNFQVLLVKHVLENKDNPIFLIALTLLTDFLTHIIFEQFGSKK